MSPGALGNKSSGAFDCPAINFPNGFFGYELSYSFEFMLSWLGKFLKIGGRKCLT